MPASEHQSMTSRLSGSVRPYGCLAILVAALHILLLYGYSRIGLAQYAARGDGREYMGMALALTQGHLIGTHFPLYPAMILLTSLAMNMQVAALVVPAIFHILFALVVYKILDTLGVDRPFLYALFLAFFPPAMMIYSSSALSDSTTLFFAGLTFYFGLVNRRNLMLLSSILAAASHYMGMLLAVPLLYWFWKNDRKKSILSLIPLTPIALFSLIQFFTIGDLLHYVTIHFTYAVRVYGTPLFSYPFASLVSIAVNLRGVERLYWFGYVSLVFVVYGIGLVYANKTRRTWSAVASVPFYALMVLYTGYYFIPRLILYAFPSLMEYGSLGRGNRLLTTIVLTVTLASVGYAIWFLLVRVPASGFVS
ncbi:MAG TPA: hypothetical protein VLV18_01855 [Terriglobales bacterium]|nr:hypothetical protein [Terriglobales bacterium]